MERTRGIEPPSQPWQGRVLTIEPRSHIMEGLDGFEPTIKVLQTHALPLGYSPMHKYYNKTNYKKSIILLKNMEEINSSIF